MTNASVRVAAALFATALAGDALAQASPRERLRQIDRNGDGAIQFSEIEAMRARLFDRLDANRDGFVDRAEAEVAAAAARSRGGGRFGGDAAAGRGLAKLDADGDGRVSRAEFVAHVPPRLAAADRDGDGALTRRELRTLRR